MRSCDKSHASFALLLGPGLPEKADAASNFFHLQRTRDDVKGTGFFEVDVLRGIDGAAKDDTSSGSERLDTLHIVLLGASPDLTVYKDRGNLARFRSGLEGIQSRRGT